MHLRAWVGPSRWQDQAVEQALWSRFTIPIVAVGLVGYGYVASRLSPVAAGALTAATLALSLVGLAETRPLAALDRLWSTRGAPFERGLPQPEGRAEGYFDALARLPDRARVGVVRGDPMLPYLALGRAVPANGRGAAGEAGVRRGPSERSGQAALTVGHKTSHPHGLYCDPDDAW